MCPAGREIPLVQDTPADGVWASWGIAFRDVAILDADNVQVATFNLTTFDLQIQANYDALKDLLKTTAGE